MDKIYYHPRAYNLHVFMTRRSYGQLGTCPIDQTPAQSFNIDPHTGRPMSDIQRLVHIQNDMDLQQQFAQLTEFKSSGISENMTDEQALRFACPRSAQLPSEIISHRVNSIKSLLEEKHANEAKLLEEQEASDRQRERETFAKYMQQVGVSKTD